MNEERLYEQLIRVCRPTIEKIEQKRLRTCKPKMFIQHSDAAQCNLQENLDFDQEAVIENTIIRWTHLALTHIHTGTAINLGEYLGAYIDITEEVPMNDKEIFSLRTALLETLHLHNEHIITFPIACKILIAGLHETIVQQNQINPGKTDIQKAISKLIHATSNITAQYSKANVTFYE